MSSDDLYLFARQLVLVAPTVITPCLRINSANKVVKYRSLFAKRHHYSDRCNIRMYPCRRRALVHRPWLYGSLQVIPT